MYDLCLRARDVSDEGIRRSEIPDQGHNTRDGHREQHEIHLPHLLYRRGAVDSPHLGRFFEDRRLVYADDLPTRRLRGEPGRAPDEPDSDDTERAAYGSAPITRSFSSEFPIVTRLQPG